MIGWLILGILALILAAAVLTPVQVRVTYDRDGLTVRAGYGPLHLQLYPRPAGEKEKKEAKPKKEKKAKKEKPEKEKKPRAKINREQILYSLEKLPPVLGKALKRAGRRVTISPLQVFLLIAGTDPADTAQLYGRLTSALASGLPVLQRTVRVREQDIRLYPDFAEERTRRGRCGREHTAMGCAGNRGVCRGKPCQVVLGIPEAGVPAACGKRDGGREGRA